MHGFVFLAISLVQFIAVALLLYAHFHMYRIAYMKLKTKAKQIEF